MVLLNKTKDNFKNLTQLYEWAGLFKLANCIVTINIYELTKSKDIFV